MSQQDQHNIFTMGAFSADAVLEEITQLRERVLIAWCERGVMLTSEERDLLATEIATTGDLLTSLTKPDS